MTERKKTHRLSALHLTAVALVDAPANPGAQIELWKRADKPEPVSMLTKFIGDPDSLDGYLRTIRSAYDEQFRDPQGGPYSYVEAVYDDFVIVCRGDDTYQIAYSVTEGQVKFGQPVAVEVQTTFKPIVKGDKPEPHKEHPVADTPTIEDVTKERDDAKAALDAAKAELDALAKMDPADVAALLGIEVAKQEQEEDVLKGLPEDVRKRLEESEAVAKAAQEQVAKLNAERRTEVAVAKAKADYANLGESDELAKLTVAVEDNCGEDVAKTLDRVLKAANAKVDLTKEIGRSFGEENDAQKQFNAVVDDILKADPSLTRPQAVAKAAETHGKLAHAAEYGS